MKERPCDRGKGRFKLGQRVQWRASRFKPLHVGTIVEVVSYGFYPEVTKPPATYPAVTWRELLKVGYYREFESYVVEDESGKRWWPRVGNLRVFDAVQQPDER